MRLVSRQAFTLLELLVTVAVISIVSFIVIRSTYTFLQEQKLRQASNELISYLLTARAKAMREAGEEGKACEVKLDASNTVAPTIDIPKNICNDSPPLRALNLLTASGGSNLTITSNQGNPPFCITFSRMGTVASTNLSPEPTCPGSVPLPQIFYLSNSSVTDVQRCVMVDLNSIRMGWRNSNSTLCSYNGN